MTEQTVVTKVEMTALIKKALAGPESAPELLRWFANKFDFEKVDEFLKCMEQIVLRDGNNPRYYADICGAALFPPIGTPPGGVKDPEIRALIMLGLINGRRREDGHDPAEVNKLFEMAKFMIADLSDGDHKARCQSFWRHQAGVFMAANGFYKQAADNQRKEAMLGASVGARVVAAYPAVLYDCYDAVVRGDKDAAASLMKVLVAAYWKMVDEVKDDEKIYKVDWRLGNGPDGLLKLMILTGNYGSFSHYLDIMRGHAAELGPVFAPCIKMHKIAELAARGDDVNAARAVERGLAFLEEEDRDPIATDFVLLLLARLYRDSGDKEKAWVYFTSIVPAPDCHVIAVVAAAESAAM